VVLFVLLPVLLTRAADDPAENGSKDAISAVVDGQPIYRREVDRAVQRTLGGRRAEEAALSVLRREALRQLINRRLVLKYLANNDLGATGQEVERQVRRVSAALEAQNLKLEDHLQQSGITLPELERSLAWEIGWQRFLDEYLTDGNLARYFQQHRRDFDGTEIVVAHILFGVERPGDSAALNKALDAAAEVRRRVLAGELTFADAARQYSSAPSAEAGGQIGAIGRHEPMPESFSRAAFQLEPGELSEPVATAAGVHLVQCQEIKPGQTRWQDVRGPLRDAVIRHLFLWAADQVRNRTSVEIKDER
jgi:parvulin-like peptidyl-prolyl isomerase